MRATSLAPADWRRLGQSLARVVWFVLAAMALAALLAAIPAYIRLVGVFTEQEQYVAGLMSLPRLYSPSAQFEFWMDVCYNTLSFGAAALSLALAALIFWRRPREPIAFVTSLTLLIYGIVMAGPLEMLLGQTLAGQSVAYAAQMLLWGFFIFLFFIFPDGRFVPGWTRWFSLLLAPWTLGLAWLQFYPWVEAHWELFFILYTGPSLAAPLAQVIRYRRVSDATQRQQTRWVILGFTAWIVGGTALSGLLIALARQLVGPATTVIQPASLALVFAARLWWPLSLTFVPLTLTVAVLRYRLFDIHVLINRALVYGGLSAGVVALYALVVGGLGALLQVSTPLAPVLLTTIGAVLLFRPLRRQLQYGVDRVMYGAAHSAPPPAARVARSAPTPAGALAPEAAPAQAAAAALPAEPAHARAPLDVWDILFRALSLAGVLEVIAFAFNLMTEPAAPGLIGQGLLIRAWAGLVVTPLLLLAGGVIIWRAPGNACGRFMTIVAVGAIALQFNFDWAGPVAAAWMTAAVILLLTGLVGPCLGYLMLTFPDGRVYPPAWKRPILAAGVVKFAGVILEILATPGRIRIFRPTINPLFVPALAPYRPLIGRTIGLISPLLFILVLVGAASLILRYRASPPLEQQRIKWVLWGFGILVPTGLFAVASAFQFGASSPVFQIGIAAAGVGQVILLVSFAVGVTRYRLFDIDVVINRTLVFGSLTVIVVGVYVIAVGFLSELFQASGSFVISLLATGLIAVFFQPLRERLQRAVNRLLYGERNDPYAVLSRLGERLEAALAPEAVLPTLVETVAQTLKLPYVAITLNHQPQTEPQVTAAFGLPSAGTIRLPLSYQGEPVGEMRIGPRGPGESFSPAEQRLLDDIAHQAGVAAHAVRLTADLQRSRERLVTAQEEERRRLRRDLHDGLGPQLASQTLTLTAALRLLRDDPVQAEALLKEAVTHAQEAVTDIRRVVYGLRPPALDDLGLPGALRAQAAEFAASGMRFSVNVPESLPPLPAAVEVACYRIAQEALTNVVKHAQAHSCALSLALEPAVVVLEVSDDGRGLPAERRAGVGLSSMRERAAELGGLCSIEPGPAGGTRVLARLPTHNGPAVGAGVG